MSDIIEGVAGNKMLQLRQDIAELRKRLAECDSEDGRRAIRKEIMNKETYYNVLADRQRIGR